jgi:hypothetical protein
LIVLMTGLIVAAPPCGFASFIAYIGIGVAFASTACFGAESSALFYAEASSRADLVVEAAA